MDGKSGFDSSTSVWQQTGWGEVDNLRKKLENLKELRDLVRQLGRAGGKGPLRKAPQEVQPSLCACLSYCGACDVLMHKTHAQAAVSTICCWVYRTFFGKRQVAQIYLFCDCPAVISSNAIDPVQVEAVTPHNKLC